MRHPLLPAVLVTSAIAFAVALGLLAMLSSTSRGGSLTMHTDSSGNEWWVETPPPPVWTSVEAWAVCWAFGLAFGTPVGLARYILWLPRPNRQVECG